MTDHELRELLHERVADVGMPDLSEVAWQRATRIRRRRAAMAVTAAVAVVAVGSVAVAGGPGGDRSTGPVTQLPSPTTTSVPSPPTPTGTGTQPDGHYRGWPVYWGPLASQESELPQVASPLPSVIDLSAPTTDVADDPIGAALAAYVLIDDNGGQRLLLLAPDGSLRTVDTSRVAAYDDGSGDDISIAHDSLLSPTGEYLAFPQAGHVMVLTLATGAWRSVDTGDRPTTTLHWMGNTDLWLPPSSQGGDGPMYSVLDGRRSGATNVAAPAGPSSTGAPYGRWRMGPLGTAQSWGRVAGLPVPPDDVTPSQALVVEGGAPAHDALLVLGSASSPDAAQRPDLCCGVEFWLDSETVVYESQTQPRRLVSWRVGTHDLGRVASIVGFDPDRELLVSSYARIWDR
jgi:hypothetical protein